MVKSYLEALKWCKTAEEAVKWNETVLPDNNIDMQYIKIAEEIKEYQEAKTKTEREKD